ncbi:hypothetical protein SAMN04244581_00974 [Paracoccus denitrificans]|jgi:hypothetical protein|nr:hypothetical protein [Paracoccus denitrificans]SDI19533.1 hypothetical protein SAMN04244581_00974 [Paracoccus denitrificans]SFQ98927.1 hypothetical protein SAMN04244569_00730 [Paracoccus denitrificans]
MQDDNAYGIAAGKLRRIVEPCERARCRGEGRDRAPGRRS